MLSTCVLCTLACPCTASGHYWRPPTAETWWANRARSSWAAPMATSTSRLASSSSRSSSQPAATASSSPRPRTCASLSAAARSCQRPSLADHRGLHRCHLSLTWRSRSDFSRADVSRTARTRCSCADSSCQASLLMLCSRSRSISSPDRSATSCSCSSSASRSKFAAMAWTDSGSWLSFCNSACNSARFCLHCVACVRSWLITSCSCAASGAGVPSAKASPAWNFCAFSRICASFLSICSMSPVILVLCMELSAEASVRWYWACFCLVVRSDSMSVIFLRMAATALSASSIAALCCSTVPLCSFKASSS
mmetsp:Transcript_69456/g.192203  ORF Transcript_69456/g.192203 Transcript_69456/m.192203 type:complete len:309 (-) Transcript_69456:753-1679(-)